MPFGITTKQIKRSAVQTIHHPPKAGDKVTVSHDFQKEKAKMVKELTPFLMYLYKKHMNAKIQEGTDLEMLKLINKAMKMMPGSPKQKKVIQQLNKLRTKNGLDPLKEDIKIPIKVGDTILGGKFKNKRIVVKSISKNDKGDITINGKPLLKFRLLDENTLNEIGIFKISQFTKGIIPQGRLDTHTPEKKKEAIKLIKNFHSMLNAFWRENDIPYRARLK